MAGGAYERPARLQPASIVLDNRYCAFAPHVQVAPVGSELRLKNSDPILHTLCTQSAQTSVDVVYGLNQKTP
jgi:hypothetical protein